MYVCIHICTSTHIYMHEAHTHMHACIHKSAHTHIGAYSCTYVQRSVRADFFQPLHLDLPPLVPLHKIRRVTYFITSSSFNSLVAFNNLVDGVITETLAVLK